MRLKYKILMLAVVPLLLSIALIAWAVQLEQSSLAERRRLQLRTAFMSAKEGELRHYVALALSTISPLYNLGRDDDEIKKQVMQRLANLDYGPDGYFFLYTMDGVNLMHPRQPELVGRNLIEMRDSGGEPTIRMLLERARSGGGFVVYHWRKPSTQVEAPKLGYVTRLERWGWMIGTGLYLDDVDEFMRQLDDELERNVHATTLWIAGAGGVGVALIFASMLLLSFSEYRVSDAKLTLLARKVVRSQEEERAYLSRELHDGTGQTLVAIKLLVESALERVDATNDVVRMPLARALERLKEALAEVRGMSHRLRPVVLDTLGLAAALQSLGEEMCAQAGIAFTMEIEGEPVELPDDVKTVLFRITQEAMTNILKHAGSANVGLRLAFDGQGLRLSIHDDGCGFDEPSVREHPRRGIGLRNMRERIETVGGRLVVQSQPGLTRVTAELSHGAIRRFGAAERGMTIRLMLVDDHPLVRDGLKARLASEADILVVGEAGDAADALQELERCDPGLVLMDIGMKDVNGIELTAMLLQRAPHLAVLMLSMYDSIEYAQRSLQAGARGYVLKDAPSSEILSALRTVAAGGTYLSAPLAQRMFRTPAPRNLLSTREHDILACLASGQSSKQIARVLGLSVRTVESHRQNIRRKLDLETQADLIKYAVEHGSRHGGPALKG